MAFKTHLERRGLRFVEDLRDFLRRLHSVLRQQKSITRLFDLRTDALQYVRSARLAVLGIKFFAVADESSFRYRPIPEVAWVGSFERRVPHSRSGSAALTFHRTLHEVLQTNRQRNTNTTAYKTIPRHI